MKEKILCLKQLYHLQKQGGFLTGVHKQLNFQKTAGQSGTFIVPVQDYIEQQCLQRWRPSGSTDLKKLCQSHNSEQLFTSLSLIRTGITNEIKFQQVMEPQVSHKQDIKLLHF